MLRYYDGYDATALDQIATNSVCSESVMARAPGPGCRRDLPESTPIGSAGKTRDGCR